jgi:hypothetical protein
VTEYVGVHEVAEIAGVSVPAVSNWQRRWKDFPEPLARLKGTPIWDGEVIRKYLRSKGRLAVRIRANEEV